MTEPSPAAPAAPPAGRLFYMDAVRAFAMFFGIIAHGSTIAHPYVDQMPLFFWIQAYNEVFRQAIFFLVSGFFMALVWQKSSFEQFVRTRIEIIVVPLIASMILIVPFNNWLIHIWHNGYMSFATYLTGGWRNPTVGNDTWALHIWFLFSLTIYAALTPLMAWIIARPWFARGLDLYLDRTAGWTHWANVLLFGIAIMLGRAAYDQIVSHFIEGWIVRATLYLLPVFFLGMMAYTNRRFLDSISVLSVPGLILFTLAYWAIRTQGDGLPRDVERVIYWIIRGGLCLFVLSSIIWFFKKYANKPGKALSFAVDAAYSFYLFHFLFIYLAAWLSRLFTDNLYVAYLFVLVLAGPATLLWHAYVINRVPLLRFLFTGKRTARTRPNPAPA